MTKQEALKQINEATNEMARTSNYPELYAAAKAKHTAAKKALIEMMSEKEEQEVVEEVESAQQELEVIVSEIEDRNNVLVKNAGVNANSVIAGIANGSISTQTEWETARIYELKQIIMAGGNVMAKRARQRNLARREARKAKKVEVIA